MEKYRWSEEIFDDLRSNIIAALDLSREQMMKKFAGLLKRKWKNTPEKIC